MRDFAFQLETAPTHLSGAAASWYQSQRTRVQTWDDFEQMFKETFIPKRNLTPFWKSMTGRVQKSKEELSFSFHEKLALCQQLDLTFQK